MGNSGSASLSAEGDSTTAAKPSFRAAVFKHRRSFRNGAAKGKAAEQAVTAVSIEQQATSSADCPVKFCGSPAAAAAAPVDILAPSAAVEAAAGEGSVEPSAGGSCDQGGTAEAAAARQLGTSLEPTYEEVPEGPGSLSSSYAEAVHHSVLLPFQATSSAPSAAEGGIRGCSAAVGSAGYVTGNDTQATAAAAAGNHRAAASDGAGALQLHSAAAGSGSRSLFDKLTRGSASKKSKKTLGKSESSKLPELDHHIKHHTGKGSDRGGDESKRGNQTRSGENLIVPAAAEGGFGSGSGHRRAASYERQLPDIPGIRVSSEETIPKKRYSDETSPKHRRALPDIPRESPAASDNGDEQIYSAMTSPRVHRTAESADASADDSYDIIQRDANPASVKIKQIKMQLGASNAYEDQYSKAVDSATANGQAESENTYCEPDTMPPVGGQAVYVAPTVSLSRPEPAVQQQQHQQQVNSNNGSVVVRRNPAGGRLGAYEQVEPTLVHVSSSSSAEAAAAAAATLSAASSVAVQRPASFNAHAAVDRHGLAPYSAIKPVRAANRPHSFGARTLQVDIHSDAAAPLLLPPVPVKRFSFSDELTSCAAVPAVAVGQADERMHALGGTADDNENEVYSEPIEAAATASATYSPHGDLPANYDILTVRPPLSAVKERLASGDARAAAEECDYYETVDQVELTVPVPAVMRQPASSSPVPPDVTESDASDLYAVPNELESAPPPKQSRKKPKSAYEEVVLPDPAVMGSMDPTSSQSMRQVAVGETSAEASTRQPEAAGKTRAEVSLGPRSDSSGMPCNAKPPRHYEYEQVDLSVVVDQPKMPVASTIGQAAVTVDAGTGGMVMPQAPSDRPLALPLTARTRLPHHYDDIDDRHLEEASRSIAAAKSARLQHHHYDEIDQVRQNKT